MNRLRPEMVRKGDMLSIDDLIEHLCIDLLGVVPEDQNVVISTNRGEPIILNDNSMAARAFNNVVQRLLGNEVDIMELEEQTFWSRLKRNLGFKN